MSETKVLHVALPADLARLVEAKVASGEHASESEVVASGLVVLMFPDDTPVGDDPEVERWLREEAVPTIEALKRDPSRLIPAAEAKKRIEAHIAHRNQE